MTAAAGYTAVVFLAAGFGAYAWSVLTGHEAITRARWAWACRKPPARTEGKLNRADHLTFIGLIETWRQSDAPERTRT